MEPRLQRRVQRYGWDLAAPGYEGLWGAQLAGVQAALLDGATLQRGERVLDLACGTGLVTLAAARTVGPSGQALGTDLSGEMVTLAAQQAERRGLPNASFTRMDAENLAVADGSVDVVLCSLGLMYVPEPERVLGEARRVLRPGGRLVVSVWGERARCGWAGLFGIVDDEVSSEVCPLFFRLGQPGALVRLCGDAGLECVEERRLPSTLNFDDGEQACDAALTGGPVALAWSRFTEATRERVRGRYLASIAPFCVGSGYAVPAEFVVLVARAPARLA
ncbi:class I SAM-dependent methyltransferase [Hydrogenophaga taeniospiralis]|uniref:class I SAM-dependent methyltransferase n=1 Tax=Hydrogenophaga taeniospiralis TaxID=65656 RepID=UPI001CFC128E|nr:methyltransferase domain-containing protein [Hydrogenophaga taeniospiralis]UCU93557.1 methyltransferase domain-containing protein [Hydrogenophaga taeniospiralis]